MTEQYEPPVGSLREIDGYMWVRVPSGHWTRVDFRGRAVGEPKTWAELTQLVPDD